MSASIFSWGARPDAECSSAVQAALFSAEKEIFFPNGVYYIARTLLIPSEKTLIFEEGAVLKMRSDRPMKRGDFLLTNADWEKGNENITLLGGVFDGNNTYPNHRRPENIFDRNGYSGILINFCNVRNLTVKNTVLADPVAYFTRFCKIDGFLLDGIRFRCTRLRPNQDGVHFCGEVRNGEVKNIRAETYGETNDDFLALNADDFPDRIEEFDTVCGPIENIVFENISAESCHSAVRLLSVTSPIRNIVFRNLDMGYRCHAVNADAARYCRATIFREEEHPNGVGRIENILFCDCTFRHTLEYPFGWCGSRGGVRYRIRLFGKQFTLGKTLRCALNVGSFMRNVRFKNVSLQNAAPLRYPHKFRPVGYAIKKAVASVRRKQPFTALFMERLPSQSVLADNKKYTLRSAEEVLTVESFSDLLFP